MKQAWILTAATAFQDSCLKTFLDAQIMVHVSCWTSVAKLVGHLAVAGCVAAHTLILLCMETGREEGWTPQMGSSGQLAQRTGVEGPGLSLWQRSLYGLWAVAGRYWASRAEAWAAAEHWLDAPSSSWRQYALPPPCLLSITCSLHLSF